MKITVVGMGKIGLPLAVQYARKGNSVIGTDINSETIKLINKGVEPFPGEQNLGIYLKQVLDDNKFIATNDTKAAVSESEVVVVVVPLFIDLDSNPDFSAMDSATKDIALGLKKGTLIIYETTLPVGTTRHRLTPLLEKVSNLKAAKDFYVVFSPERVLTGRVFSDLRRYPKLVGGISKESELKGIKFYEKVLDFDKRIDLHKPNGVWAMGSSEAAEMAKLAETTYRDVNIALANQFALFSDRNQIDFYAVQQACNSQPFSHIHLPGIAVGGHCIPVYPRLYLWNDPQATVVEAAREANLKMPEIIVKRIQKEFGSLQGMKVVILGASYRGGVKETAYSGIFPLVKNFEKNGANVWVHDPLFTEDEITNFGFKNYELGEYVDIVVVQADHKEYEKITTEDLPGVKLILDGRNILNRENLREVTKFFRIGNIEILKN